MATEAIPNLYWISGSPPSWRVILALTLKGVAFNAIRLDPARGENRTDAYLALNPTGQVPTLTHGTITVRESIAILAYLDRAWPERPIFGTTAAEAAAIWQAVMVFEARLAPVGGAVARALLRNQAHDDPTSFMHALEALCGQLDKLDCSLASAPFVSGTAPRAADIWLHPLLGWLDRAVAVTTDLVPEALTRLCMDRPHLSAWRERFGALPGVTDTYPPHWRTTPSKHN